jgi:hypothetical protein
MCTDEDTPGDTIKTAPVCSTSKYQASGSRNKAGSPPSTLRYPTKLPKWSSGVEAFIKEEKCVEHIHHIVREAVFFLQATCPRPLAKEYEAFSRTLCDAIPELKKLPGTSDHCHVSLLFLFQPPLPKFANRIIVF